MPSFDIVSKVDLQSLDNAINNAVKEVATRYDFRDSKTSIDLDKKNYVISVVTENDMRLDAIGDVLIIRIMKQKIDASCLDFGKEHYSSGNMVKKDIRVKQGIEKEIGKKIVKVIKDSRLKVNASIMDDQIRVDGKKLDDLQAAISIVRQGDFEIPLQFVNMK